jgi:anti-sigma regulatory factor (Ser/Thr protein kinase)
MTGQALDGRDPVDGSGVRSDASARGVDLPFTLVSVQQARGAMAADLAELGVADPGRTDALVVLSELVGNALRHARPLRDGSVRAMWRVGPAEIEIAVADGGAQTSPRADRPPFAALSGRGLGIVDALCDSWGVEGSGTADQLVWAVVPRATLPHHGT